jgi:hypothetical protein
MSDAVKIGSALAGGYLLGRTKKAKMAIGLAMWLAGKGRPRDLLRTGVITLAQTPEVQQMIKQARGPLLEAARGAATSTFNAQLGSLASDINRRTGVLTGKAESILPEGEEPEDEHDEAPEDEYDEDEQDEQDEEPEDEHEEAPEDEHEPEPEPERRTSRRRRSSLRRSSRGPSRRSSRRGSSESRPARRSTSE